MPANKTALSLGARVLTIFNPSVKMRRIPYSIVLLVMTVVSLLYTMILVKTYQDHHWYHSNMLWVFVSGIYFRFIGYLIVVYAALKRLKDIGFNRVWLIVYVIIEFFFNLNYAYFSYLHEIIKHTPIHLYIINFIAPFTLKGFFPVGLYIHRFSSWQG